MADDVLLAKARIVERGPEDLGKPRSTEITAMLRDLFAKHAPELRGYRVFLFGSRASGRAGHRSDFDVGVLGETPLRPEVFFKIEDDLEALPTLHKVDWVNLNLVSPEFRERALEETELLYG